MPSVSLPFSSGPMAHYSSQSGQALPTAEPGLELRCLDDSVQKLLAAGLSSVTMRSYQSGCSHFVSLCNDMNLAPFPLCKSTLCHFVAFLVNQHLTLGTIWLCLSALHLHQIAEGGSDPSMEDMAQLHYVLQGTALIARGISRPLCLPITLDILVRLFHVWKDLPDWYKASLLWAAATLGFFGSYGWGSLQWCIIVTSFPLLLRMSGWTVMLTPPSWP